MDKQTKMLLQRAKGSDWEWELGKTATVYMDFQMDFTNKKGIGHLVLIRSILQYYNIDTVDGEYIWCDTCLNRHTRNTLCIERKFGCRGCGREFMDQDCLDNHQLQEYPFEDMLCPFCNVPCFNQECLDMHRCRQRKYVFCDTCNQNMRHRSVEAHVCDEYVCKTCD